MHLGFLQHRHRYRIDLRLPAKWLRAADVATGDAATGGEQLRLVADGKYATNVHCWLVGFHLDGDDDGAQQSSSAGQQPALSSYCNIHVEYFAHDEHLLKEELKLVNAQNAQDVLKFVITARVLGRGKGTPMLRTGIHCIGSEEPPEATGFESDESDICNHPCTTTSQLQQAVHQQTAATSHTSTAAAVDESPTKS